MLFIILIFLIFACAVTYYYLTIQPHDSTSNPEQSVLTTLDTTPTMTEMATYNGPGFSIQYPSDFIATEKPEFGWSIMEAPQAVDESTGKESVMVSYKDTTETNVCTKIPDGYTQAECVTINEISWLDWRAESLVEAMGPITHIYSTIHNGKLYKLTFLSFTDTARKDKILHSFSFTN